MNKGETAKKILKEYIYYWCLSDRKRARKMDFESYIHVSFSDLRYHTIYKAFSSSVQEIDQLIVDELKKNHRYILKQA